MQFVATVAEEIAYASHPPPQFTLRVSDCFATFLCSLLCHLPYIRDAPFDLLAP